MKLSPEQSRPEEKYITAQEAAVLIGITQQAVYQAIEKKQLFARRFSNVWQVSKDSAERYKERREEAK